MQATREACHPNQTQRPSEAEILRMVEEAALAYEETLQISNLADHLADEEAFNPKYDWNTPIGFLVR